MPQKRYLVTLTADERRDLARLVSAGKRSARTLTRARILLKADQASGGPAWDAARIAEALGCGHRTVERSASGSSSAAWTPHWPTSRRTRPAGSASSTALPRRG